MPYIVQERRKELETPVELAPSAYPGSPGELNFEFTGAIVNYIDEVGLNYRTINDVLGALEGAKMEFYRRIVVPYEEKKIAQHGDVYPIDEYKAAGVL